LAAAQARLNKYVVEQLVQTSSVLHPITMTHLLNCQVDYDDKLKSAYGLSDQKD
jgi:hypothetical protein